MIPINKPMTEYGFYLMYDGTPPEGTELDEVGCIGKGGFKSAEAAIAEIRTLDLIDDIKDIVLIYGINTDGYLVILPPLGFLTGEDFLSPA